MAINDGRRRGGRLFTISVAAELVNVHPQTLRHYEREDLIRPQRGKGEIRYFSADDIERIMLIRRLVDDLKVNLAGVHVILNMREQMEEMKHEAEQTIADLKAQHEIETRRLKDIIWRLQGGNRESDGPENW